MQIAIPIFPAFTALDAIGPYEVLQRLPEAEVVFCSEERGPIRTEQGMLAIVADRALSEVPEPDVVVVPGGSGTRHMLSPDDPYVRWIASVHEATTWTTSVCTGSTLLAAAGVLHGTDASTHWAARGLLDQLGAVSVPDRVVERGRVMTAAGGPRDRHGAAARGADRRLPVAEAIQLGIEYDPDPPFDSGSLEKASPEVLETCGVALAAEDGRAVEVHGLGGG